MLSWCVVSLMSAFAVVAGLLTGVPGLLGTPTTSDDVDTRDSDITRGKSKKAARGVISSRKVRPDKTGDGGAFTHTNPLRRAPKAAEHGGSGDADLSHGRASHISAVQADAAAESGVHNPYAVTVQQYGRWYTALLLLYEFNKISDIATSLILGVSDPLRASFFALGLVSLVHVQATFYWLVGTRDGDTTVIDLYRGFGDVVLDTPMLGIEFYAIATGIIAETNFTVFIISLVLKGLSTVSHVFTLYKDIKLFLESRSRQNFRHLGSNLRKTLTKSKLFIQQVPGSASFRLRAASIQKKKELSMYATARTKGNNRANDAGLGDKQAQQKQANLRAKTPHVLAETLDLPGKRGVIVRAPMNSLLRVQDSA
jgi:hypothetical protein